VRELYLNRLLKRKSITQEEYDEMKNRTQRLMDESFDKIKKKSISEFKTDVPLGVSKEEMKSKAKRRRLLQ
jgi:2-oxoglutarate dehydrogenase complex dehydrogenase (E1) component-like enzyme